jgi:uncharacterized protein
VPDLIQTGLWRWIKSSGLERFELLRMPHEWMLRGTIVTLAGGRPAEARYEVLCDDSWQTRLANISLRDETGERVLQVAVEGGQWYANGCTQETLAGCTDIDLEWSPSTNTIPIRRLRLAVGERSGPVIASWVRFPGLTLQPLLQEYERTSEHNYRYSSDGGAFLAEIAVDEEGLIQNYEGLWQREIDKLDE